VRSVIAFALGVFTGLAIMLAALTYAAMIQNREEQ